MTPWERNGDRDVALWVLCPSPHLLPTFNERRSPRPKTGLFLRSKVLSHICCHRLPARDNHTLNFCHGKAFALGSTDLSLTKGKIQQLSCNMSVFQKSPGFDISGSTFNVIGGNQINHTHFYLGKFLPFW
jgi:hypothetical protein